MAWDKASGKLGGDTKRGTRGKEGEGGTPPFSLGQPGLS